MPHPGMRGTLPHSGRYAWDDIGLPVRALSVWARFPGGVYTMSFGTLIRAEILLEKLLESRRVPRSHGIEHARAVLDHVDRALGPDRLEELGALNVRLAALLHDADDRKYFPNSRGCANARRILQDVQTSPEDAEEVIRMIDLVSTAKNGNSVPEEARDRPELLWPRWCDRLEACGMIGAVRCWRFSLEAGRPLALPETPAPRTAEEAWAAATPERFRAYQAAGQSQSMLDHYFDKLLHIVRLDPAVVRNDYIVKAMAERTTPLLEVCVAYGTNGRVPEDLIRSWAA